MRLAQIMY